MDHSDAIIKCNYIWHMF